MSLMYFRCVSIFFDVFVLDSDFTHVHFLHSMTRDSGKKVLMGKTSYLYVVDLKKEGNTSRWNFDCHDQYSNGPCTNGLYCIRKNNKEPIRIFNVTTRKMLLRSFYRKNFHLIKIFILLFARL